MSTPSQDGHDGICPIIVWFIDRYIIHIYMSIIPRPPGVLIITRSFECRDYDIN